jgi:hypothetical protein
LAGKSALVVGGGKRSKGLLAARKLENRWSGHQREFRASPTIIVS